MLELVPVAHAHDSVCQLHGTPVFIHIGDPHHQIRIFAVGGEIDHSLGVSGDGKFLLQNTSGVAEYIGPLLLVCVVFRHLQFIFRHIDDMGGRIFRIVCKMIPTFIFRSREAEGSMACLAAASNCHIRSFAVQVEGHLLSIGQRPVLSRLPLAASHGIVFHHGSLFDPVFHAL